MQWSEEDRDGDGHWFCIYAGISNKEKTIKYDILPAFIRALLLSQPRRAYEMFVERQLTADSLPDAGCRSSLLLSENGEISLPPGRWLGGRLLPGRTTK